jgi:hypothetical protein
MGQTPMIPSLPGPWQPPQARLDGRPEPRPRSERRKNTVIAWCLVGANCTVGWWGTLAQVACLAAGVWLTWRHFALVRAARRQPPIVWPSTT